MRLQTILGTLFVTFFATIVNAQEQKPLLVIPKVMKCSVARNGIVTHPNEVMLSVTQNPLVIRTSEIGKKGSILKIQNDLIDIRGSVVKADELHACRPLKNEHTEVSFEYHYACSFFPYGPNNGLSRGTTLARVTLFKTTIGIRGSVMVQENGHGNLWASMSFINCAAQ
jgi:hypothetical protein